jgi:hypothetical protein
MSLALSAAAVELVDPDGAFQLIDEEARSFQKQGR